MELRLMAHFSQDQNLINLFQMEGVDPFKALASFWLKKSSAEITKDDRDNEKHLCYGLLYGMVIKSLADKMNLTLNQAQKMKNNFDGCIQGVASWK